jgi:hypothetical protein
VDYIEPTQPQQIYNYPDLLGSPYTTYGRISNYTSYYERISNNASYYGRVPSGSPPSYQTGTAPSYQTADR